MQRKELAQKTKDFRKLDDAGKLADIKSMIKAYQSFIDLITNQSKSVQTAFLQIYSPISEAPDPYPLLEASVDSIIKSEEVIPKLESENKHLQTTVSSLSNQLENVERELEEERAARQTSALTQDSKIKDIEQSWNAVLKEKQDNWEAREKGLEEKAENQDRLIKELKASLEVSQRMGNSEDSDQDQPRGLASAAELDIMNSELDKAHMRLADLEARNEQLSLDLAQSTARAGESVKPAPVEDDPAFLRLRSENSSLLRKLEASRYEKESEKDRSNGNTRTFEREISALKEDRETLRKKMEKMADYDEVKQELEMLKVIESSAFHTIISANTQKSIEFATGDADDSELEDNTDTPASSGSDSLEKLLLTRNKKLTNELTILRVSHNDLQSRLSALEESLQTATSDLDKSRALNAQLENDLHATQQEAMNAFDPSAMSVAGGTYTSRYPKSSYAASTRRNGGATSPTSSIISGFDSSHSPRGLDSLRANDTSPGAGILPMVTAQRDRFKQKISILETDLQKQYTTVSELRSEIASLQKDNLGLYEKTRYVNSYNRNPASSSSAYSTNPNPSTVQIGGGSSGAADDRYRSAYEANISPFAAFRGRESARAFKRMSLPERAIFQVTRMVLATRTSRNLFAAYCVALHILVFVMLFSMGTGSEGGVHQVASAAAGAAAGGIGKTGGAGNAGAAAAGGGGTGSGGGDWVKQEFHDR